jgi:hypothetical protein
MADVPGTRRLVGIALMGSAIALGAAAYLISAGTIPAPALAAYALGVVAVLDFLLGIVFFRMGQSS